jgi:predicted thioesterase
VSTTRPDLARCPLGTRLEIEAPGGTPTPPSDLLRAGGLIDHPAAILSLHWHHGDGIRPRAVGLAAELGERWVRTGSDELTWDLTTSGPSGPAATGTLVTAVEIDPGRADLPRVLPHRIGEGIDLSIRPGTSIEQTDVIGEHNTTRHLGGRPLLATPSMISALEQAAADHAAPYLADGFGTVGVFNLITHSKPAYPDREIVFRATLTGVAGHRLSYRVGARVDDHEVGHGRHQSHVVRLRRNDG